MNSEIEKDVLILRLANIVNYPIDRSLDHIALQKWCRENEVAILEACEFLLRIHPECCKDYETILQLKKDTIDLGMSGHAYILG